MWHEVKAAHDAGEIRAVEIRASDYVGGGVGPNQSMLVRYAQAAAAGRRVSVFGSADVLHTFTYVSDVAQTLLTVAQEPAAWGRAWRVPSPAAVTIRGALKSLTDVLGAPSPRIRTIPRWALWPAYPFVPLLREVDEVLYQWESDFVMDHAAATELLGLQPAQWDQIIADLAGQVRTPQRS
ncbi:NAD-dependent epimerase/dehydratase family protein [Nesterenkonia flava]|uniref:NAD-dependent epimerase/dehydratase family protein n=1 Tax=Nesterenkonia flava TaxID=469799 RepID=A0ABU1FRA2_9MICC|nr:NAD-dependent epimerase/dehydratase family protein [Nesterenkonia flava]MDR5711180.1 NAD-dependent epimerase/dehydratase family protein [Nesterenkonia flava]